MQSLNQKNVFLGGGSDFTLFRKCAEPSRKTAGWLVFIAQLPRFVENPAKAQVPQELLLLKLLSLLWPYLVARFGRSSGSITEGFCAGESFLLT